LLTSGDHSQLRANYARICEEVGSGVTVIVATKYVDLQGMQMLAEVGIEVVGENRLQDLAVKQDRFGARFRWHFIGHLQSRKAKEISERCELLHSLDSLSAAKRLDIPALVEVNLSGEETKSGVPREQLSSFLAEVRELGADVRGLMTMPPLADDPERSRPFFRELRDLAGEHGLEELSMGTSQDYRVAVEEGATLVRVGSVVFGR
jgi:pyridoxal phosphate enzyme (YggS family)